ncbi:hypothetical protein [Nocardia veterana]|nr:hypothetical protein [Nocardia veterana]
MDGAILVVAATGGAMPAVGAGAHQPIQRELLGAVPARAAAG